MNLQSLADELGLARSTISRALRDDPLIAADTRQRVKQAAEKIGYRSNPYISVLMSQVRGGARPSESPIIAFLNPQATRSGWRDNKPMVAALRSATARGEELGYKVEEFWLGEPGMTSERLAEILLTRGIRAVILGAPGHTTELIPFATQGFAAVAIDLEPDRQHLPRATTDYLGNTQTALQSLRTLGYRRIGLAIEKDSLRILHHLPRMAFLDFEESLPHANRTGFWCGAAHDVAGFAQWLIDRRPDALVTLNIMPQAWLQSLGFRIPQDIGVAQLDPDFINFPLSGIDGRFDVAGRNAMELLISQISRNEFGPPPNPMHILNRGTWLSGASTMDRRTTPGADPYDDLRLALCHEVIADNRSSLADHRRKFAARFYTKPFPLAADAPSGAWHCLSLAPAANQPFHSPVFLPTFPGRHRYGPPAGRHVLRGVPFDVPPTNEGGPDTVIALHSHHELQGRKTVPVTHRLPVGRPVRCIYLLLGAFCVWSPAPVARCRWVFDDGTTEHVDLIPYWPGTNSTDQAALQDSWVAEPQFESDRAKPVFVPSDTQPFARDAFFYVYELRNPRPDRKVLTIEFITNPTTAAAVLVAGVTALLPADSPKAVA